MRETAVRVQANVWPQSYGTGEESADVWEGHSLSTLGEEGRRQAGQQTSLGPPGTNGEMLNAMASFSFLLGEWPRRSLVLVCSGHAAGRRQYVPWFLRGQQLAAATVWTHL